MVNVLDVEPVRAMAHRAAAVLEDQAIAARFQKLAFEHLLADPRNFRAGLTVEIESGPDWARAASLRGEEISVFAPPRGALVRLRAKAQRLANTCALAGCEASGELLRYKGVIAEARRFLAKFDRTNLAVACRRALQFSRALEQWQADRDSAEFYPAQTIAATEGRSWFNAPSIAALRQIGREFRNCLATSARSSSYVALLRRGRAQIWVLRDAEAAGLIVVLAPTEKGGSLNEVKGPRNVAVSPEHPDLLLLADALGLSVRQPLNPFDLIELRELRARNERLLREMGVLPPVQLTPLQPGPAFTPAEVVAIPRALPSDDELDLIAVRQRLLRALPGSRRAGGRLR